MDGNPDLVDGETPPSVGDRVRVRALRDGEGVLVVDRPYRDRPLEVTSTGTIEVPVQTGTYRITGRVKRVTRAEADGPDYLFLSEPEVEMVSEDLAEIPRDDDPEWRDRDASDADVDVDVESVVSETTGTQESTDTGAAGAGVGDFRSGDFNVLLLQTGD